MLPQMLSTLPIGLAQVTHQQVFEWAGLPAGWARALLFGVVAALGVLAMVLYRAEYRSGASARLRTLLAVLRCIVIIALAVVWLEPVLVTYAHRYVEARVAVLADVSASMSVADPGERVTDGAGEIRAEAVRRRLYADDARWLRRLREHNAVDLYVFGGETTRVPLPWSTEVSASRPAVDAFAPIQPRTDFGQTLATVLDDVGDGPSAGVILFSDGGLNQGLSLDETVALARRLAGPVYCVGVGALDEPPNLRITGLLAPATVPQGDPFEIRVDLVGAGMSETPIEVELVARRTSPGGTATDTAETRPAQKSARVGDDQPPATVLFEVTPPAPGQYTYRARVLPPPDLVEALTDDNAREASVLVLDELLRVLIVAGGPTYEYRYVTRLLERDRSIDVSCWLQSADEQALRDGNTILEALPREPAALFAYDAILLLDPDPEELDAAWALTLRRCVDEMGGGVLLEAGPQYTARFLRDPRLDEFVAILPVVPDPDVEVRLNTLGTYRTSPLSVQPPESVAGHPLVALDAEASTSLQLWQALGGTWWHLPVLRAKPVATVLLERGGDLPTVAEQGDVVMAAQPVGPGRAVFLGMDSTWRWRGPAEPLFNRFWIQLVRYLAQSRRQQASRFGTLTLDRESFSVGDYVRVEARVLDRAYAPWPEPEVRAELEWADGTTEPCILKAIAGRDGWFAGRLLLSREGPAELRVPLPTTGGSEPAPASPEFLRERIRVLRPDVEMVSLRQRRDVLSALAVQTGGAYVALSDVDSLPDRIPNAGQRQPPQRLSATPLWDRTWVLGVIAALLCTEWALRRRYHLL
ncbi:MAG: vWA domain-containing protein [Phycisphaerae bacterium]|jgi:hypothetical protein